MGLLGVGLAHFLWWSIVSKLPATTASIGALLVPVIGVFCSAFVLGERPTASDITGFALIFAAAACVLLSSGYKRDGRPE
jgi:drug/metabolite transporter (DMT)-like permease